MIDHEILYNFPIKNIKCQFLRKGLLHQFIMRNQCLYLKSYDAIIKTDKKYIYFYYFVAVKFVNSFIPLIIILFKKAKLFYFLKIKNKYVKNRLKSFSFLQICNKLQSERLKFDISIHFSTSCKN